MDKEEDQIIEVSVFSKDNNEIRLEVPELNHTDVTCKDLLEKISDVLDEQSTELNESNEQFKSIDKIFSLSLNSKYLELPLKESYKPFGILICWSELLKNFSPKYHHLKPDLIEEDQPVLSIQRNSFLTKCEEMKLNNEFTLKLLYEEARSNFLVGKYQVTEGDYLAAIQLKIDYLRTNNDQLLSSQYLKENLDQYVPNNCLQSTAGSFLTLNRLRNISLDQRIISIFKSNELNLSLKQLYKEYLKRCHQLPHYGSVFFHGQIEKNQSMFTSLIKNQDLKVYVAINYEGVHFIDKKSSKLILSLAYDTFLWELAVPQSISENQNALPCLFIEINDETEKKIMQIFSKQAKLMDNTLREFDEKIRASQDVVDSSSFNSSISSSKSSKSLKKSLNFCSCATFNKKGDCVKKQGSFKFVKKF